MKHSYSIKRLISWNYNYVIKVLLAFQTASKVSTGSQQSAAVVVVVVVLLFVVVCAVVDISAH